MSNQTNDSAVDEVALSARHLVKEYDVKGRTFTAVDDVSIDIVRARTTALVGESGSGKSTVARMCALLLEPTSGRIHLNGDERSVRESRASLASFRKRVQVVFQDPYSSLNPRHTVEDILCSSLRYLKLSLKQSRREFAQHLMQRVGLNPDHVDRLPSQFSGGQAQRIGIARAVACKPEVIVCDEAVSALDVSVQSEILDLLAGLQTDYGFSYLFITHDLSVVRQVADSIVVMRGGRIIEQGAAVDVLDRPRSNYTKNLIETAPRFPADWTV